MQVTTHFLPPTIRDQWYLAYARIRLFGPDEYAMNINVVLLLSCHNHPRPSYIHYWPNTPKPGYFSCIECTILYTISVHYWAGIFKTDHWNCEKMSISCPLPCRIFRISFLV